MSSGRLLLVPIEDIKLLGTNAAILLHYLTQLQPEGSDDKIYTDWETIRRDLGWSLRQITTAVNRLLRSYLLLVRNNKLVVTKSSNYQHIGHYQLKTKQINALSMVTTTPADKALSGREKYNIIYFKDNNALVLLSYNKLTSKIDNKINNISHLQTTESSVVTKQEKLALNLLVKSVLLRRNMKITEQQKRSWLRPLRELVSRNGINITRIVKALTWYCALWALKKDMKKHPDNFNNDFLMNEFSQLYPPDIQSGRSLRNKFHKLEAAMERCRSLPHLWDYTRDYMKRIMKELASEVATSEGDNGERT